MEFKVTADNTADLVHFVSPNLFRKLLLSVKLALKKNPAGYK